MNQPTLAGASLYGLCPRCASKTLFAGPVRLAERCPVCGLDVAAMNVGDGPAAFLILIVGAIVAVAAILVQLAWFPPWWVHLVWLPVIVGLTVLGLRLGKAALVFQEYKHEAREGRIVE